MKKQGMGVIMYEKNYVVKEKIMRDIIENRKMVAYLIKNDFRMKYAGSLFGIIWAFVQPIVTILIYWFVFQVGFHSSDVNETPFVLWLMAGLIPWFFFSESVVSASNCFAEYSYLVKKVVFNIDILPIVKVASSLYVHLFFIAIMLILYAVSGCFPGIIAVQILYYVVCTIALVLSIVYFTAAIAVFFKDTMQIINIMMNIGVWLTPIMWQITTLSEKMIYLFSLNPVFYIVEGYRDTLIVGRWFFEKPVYTLYFWGVIAVMAWVSKKIYKRLKPHFSDSL